MTLSRATDRIETDRLTLRRIEQNDFDFFVQLDSDPEVARFLPHANPRSPHESLAWLQSLLDSYKNFGSGQLAVLRKSDGAIIGRCGLSDLAVEVKASVAPVVRGWYLRSDAPPASEIIFEQELGYTFHRSSWGQGYAAEAARCVFEYARDVLKLPRIISLIHPENVRSLRLAQRFGVEFEDNVEVRSRLYQRFVWPIQSAAHAG
jgi:[ribosomal protein S5]-alanine N-acetyltransferase